MIEGSLQPDGSWLADAGSPYRSLTAREVEELRTMATNKTPIFGGDHNASWSDHHPIARAIWEQRGLKPAE